MKEKIDLSSYGHAKSPLIKELIFLYEKEGIGYYRVHSEWPDNPNIGPIRMGYNNDIVDFIDFDGGPFLQVGSKIDNYEIVDFSKSYEFPIKVMLKENATTD